MAGIDELRERVQGQVIGTEDAGYEDARKVFNAMIDRRPRLIVRPATSADVAAAVNFARDDGLELAVRGGGHSVPGFGTVDDGLVIDLSSMRAVTVDPANATARAQGGATWGDFNTATHEFGLATTGGVVSTTGVGGLTTGGGIGYLARGYGLSCDNLVSAEVVTADGRTLVGQRPRERGPVLGDPRRERQLRGGDLVRVPAPPGEGHLRRADVLRAGRRQVGAGVLPRVHRGRPRAVRGVPRLADRTTPPVHPRGPSRRGLPGVRGLLGG